MPSADARRRAGGDDVAGQQRHVAATRRRRAAATPKIIVRVLPVCRRSPLTSSHMSRFCGSLISSVVTSHGPIGPKVSQPLPLLHWRRAALQLELALGHVVDDAVAGDVAQRVLHGDIARRAADDDAELDFPVELRRVLRQHDVVVGADDAGRRLEEHDRMLGDRRARFLRVVDEVEADGDELRRRRDARSEARLALDERQPPRVELAQAGSDRGRERVAVDVVDLARQVAQLAVGVDQAGLFLAGGP